MRILTAAFVLTLLYAHRDGDVLDQPLSMFRDGSQRYLGVILFLLLGMIGAILIRKLLRLRGYVGVFTLSLGFVLLAIVALTQSWDDLHKLCAFGLLSLIGFYYTMWLRMEKPYWVWPHLMLMAAILYGAAFSSYGFWQKTLIVYLVALINVQHSFLKHIPAATGVQYTLLSAANKRLPPRQTVYRLDREFFGTRGDES